MKENIMLSGRYSNFGVWKWFFGLIALAEGILLIVVYNKLKISDIYYIAMTEIIFIAVFLTAFFKSGKICITNSALYITRTFGFNKEVRLDEIKEIKFNNNGRLKLKYNKLEIISNKLKIIRKDGKVFRALKNISPYRLYGIIWLLHRYYKILPLFIFLDLQYNMKKNTYPDEVEIKYQRFFYKNDQLQYQDAGFLFSYKDNSYYIPCSAALKPDGLLNTIGGMTVGFSITKELHLADVDSYTLPVRSLFANIIKSNFENKKDIFNKITADMGGNIINKNQSNTTFKMGDFDIKIKSFNN